MKLQWSIQSSHIQLARSQVTYLTSRNEHIRHLPPPNQSVYIDWKFFIWLPFFILFDQYNSIFQQQCYEIFYISLRNKPLALTSYILNTICSTLVKLVFETRFFQLFLFLGIDICRAFCHKKINVRKYIGRSIRMYQDQIKPLTNHLWQTWRSIYNNWT